MRIVTIKNKTKKKQEMCAQQLYLCPYSGEVIGYVRRKDGDERVKTWVPSFCEASFKEVCLKGKNWLFQTVVGPDVKDNAQYIFF